MKKYEDYIYATPVFVFKKTFPWGEEVELFTTCWTINNENELVDYPLNSRATIEDFYDGLEETRKIKRGKSWAV
jgi:hypothetical protein